jgi:hypothetical protein
MRDKDDTFAHFRRAAGQEPEQTSTAQPAPEPEANDNEEPYRLPSLHPDKYTAFRLGKRRERLLIARAGQPMRFPAYHELRDISFDQAYQQGFNLFFHAMTVEVTGKSLWPVVHAISCGRCEGIFEYHAKLYPALPAKGEPLIESIKIEPPVALSDES